MDNRYVVDILLEAKDRTGAALTSVQTKLKGLDDKLGGLDKSLNKFDQDFRRVSSGLRNDLDKALQKVGGSLDDTNTKADKLMRTMREQEKVQKESKKSLEDLNKELGENGNAVQNAENRVKSYSTTIKKLETEIITLTNKEGDHTDAIVKKEEAIAKWQRRAEVQLQLLNDLGDASEGLNESGKKHTEMLEREERQMHTIRDAYIKLNEEKERSAKAGVPKAELDEIDGRLTSLRRKAEETYKAIQTLSASPDDPRFSTGATYDESEIRRRREAAEQQKKEAREVLDVLVQTEMKRRDLIADRIQAEKQAHNESVRLSKLSREDQDASIKQFEDLQDRRLAAVRKSEREIERLTKEGARNRAEYQRLEASGADPKQLAALDRDYASTRQRGALAYAKRDQAANMDVSTGDASAKMLLLKRQIKSVDGHYQIEFDVDAGKAMAELVLLNAAKEKAAEAPRTGLLNTFFDKLRQEANRSRNSIAQFDNNLRGMAVFAAVLSLQQLVTVLMAAGAQLVAVASSAIMAGGALAGGLTAGAAQAIPMIGILAASLARLGAVFEAVKQSDLLKQQQFAEGQKGDQAAADNTDAIANANDGLRSALDGVADAQRNLAEAQMDLVRARFASGRQLEDMILQEKEAALAAQGAVLSQRDARRELQRSIAEGDVGALAGDRLDIQGARLDVRSTRLDANRASQDLSLQQSGSPLRPDRGVEQAQKAVADARRALLEAQRAADGAQRSLKAAATSAATAGAAGLASASKMDYMLKQMSDSERRLYRNVLSLKDTYQKAFRPITDIMVDAFSRGAKRSEKVLKDPGLMGALRGLSGEMAKGLDRVTKMFTNPTWVRFFTSMTKEASKNAGPMVDTFLALGRTFKNIAEAASPLWGRMVRWIRDGAEAFEDWVGKGKSLTEFFDSGEEHLKSWGKLIGAIGELFLELVGASADSGKESVDDLTKHIQDATNWIQTHGKEVRNFFAEAQDVMEQVGEVIVDLGAALFRLFDPKSVEALAEIFSDILIPAFEKTIEGFGTMFKFMEKIAQVPGAKQLLQMAVIGALVSKVMHALAGSFRGLLILGEKLSKPLGTLAARLGLFGPAAAQAAVGGEALGGVMAALTGPVGLTILAIAALTAAFVYLSMKFGVWDEVVGAAKKSWQNFTNQIDGPIDDLLNSFKRLGKAFGLFGGEAQGLGKLFRWLFVNVVRSIVIPALEEFGTIIGKTFGGVIKIIGGFVNILADIFTGDFGKIPGHFKDILEGIFMIVSGMVQRITLPFRLMFRIVWSLVKSGMKKAADAVGDGIGWVWDQMKKLPDLAKKAVTGYINIWKGIGGRILGGLKNGFDSVWDFLKSMPGRMANAGANVAKAFARGIGRIPSLIADAFKGAGDLIGGIVGSITKFINEKTQFGDNVDLGLFSIDLPALPEKFARGGPVNGQGDGDTVPALLTPGEHVFTKAEVAAAGGHEAIFAIRSMFGGGTQGGRGGRYAQGGAVQNISTATAQQPDAGTLGMDILLKIIESFGAKASDTWNSIWTGMRKTTASANDKIAKDTDDSLAKTLKIAKRQLGKMSDAFSTSFSRSKKIVGKGFDYIIDTTNKSLKAFGVDPVSISVKTPGDETQGGGEGHAHGGYAGGVRGFATGFLGQQGERGGDKIPAWLGRGEAVLNYAQQRFVEPAMRKFYGMGLGEMFGRTDSRHGAERAGGYARGRFIWPTESHLMTSDFGARSSPGGIGSTSHDGIDIGVPDGTPVHATADGHVTMAAPNGGYGNYVELAHSGGVSSFYGHLMKWLVRAGQQVKAGQQIAVSDNTGSSTGPHLHFGMHQNGTPIDPLPLLQGGALSGAAAQIEKLKKLKMMGDKGPLKDILQKAFDKSVGAANKYITDKAPVTTGGNFNFAGIGASSDNQKMGRQMMGRIWPMSQWPSLQELWTRESGWDEGATNPSSGAYGIPQSLPASKMGPAAQGTGPAAAKAQIAWGLQYIKDRYGSPSSALSFHDSNNWYTKGKAVVEQGAKWLIDAGLDHKAAAGMFGNSYGESGWDTEAMEPGTNNGGLFGFTASPVSLPDMQAWARKMKLNWKSVEAQVRFAVRDLKNRLPGTFRKMNQQDKISDTTSTFMHEWERPLNYSSLGKRIKAGYDASDIMRGLNLGDPDDEKSEDKIKDVQMKLSDKEFQKVLPKSLRPAVENFDGWFTKKFGKDPTSVRFGRTSGVMASVRESVSSWAEDFLDQARSYTATKKGDKVVETSLYDPDDDDKKKKKKKQGIGAGAARAVSRVQEFATGGTVKGALGEPVGIIAHAGEMVLNQAQQALLGGADYLKRVLGFDGKPKASFSDGGEVKKLGGKLIMGKPFSIVAGLLGFDPEKEFGTPMEEFLKGIRAMNKDVKKLLNQGSKIFKKKGVDLSNVITGMFDRLTGEGGVLDTMGEAFEVYSQMLANNLGRATVKINAKGRVIGRRLQADDILVKEAENISRELTLLMGEKGVINKAMQKARQALRIARRRGDTKAEEAAQAAINNLEVRQRDNDTELVAKRLEALAKMEEKLQAWVDRINDKADTAAMGVDLAQRIAAATGQEGLGIAQTLQQASIDAAKDQIAALQKALAVARKQGNEEIAKELEKQIAELGVVVLEGAAALIQIAADYVQSDMDKVATSASLKDRWGQVSAGYGATEWGNAVQGAGLRETQQGLFTAIGAQQNVIAQAEAAGLGPSITGPLKDTLNDLIAQLAENALAIFENTIQQRQLSIDLVANRQSFFGGVSDGLKSIVESVATATGSVDLPLLTNIMTKALDQLKTTGDLLRDQMTRFVGEAGGALPASVQSILSSLQGLRGNDFVNAINGLDQNAIVAMLGGQDSPLAQQFESLLQQLIDNEAAIQANTNELAEATKLNKIQSFTSTAWTWFRSAIFNGMGGLLPQYAAGTPYYNDTTGMAEGGPVVGDGPRWVHDQEFIVPAQFGRALITLARTGAIATGLSDGSLQGTQINSRIGAGMASGVSQGLALESNSAAYERLRQALLANSQNIETHIHEAESGTDATYLSERIAHATKIPTT